MPPWPGSWTSSSVVTLQHAPRQGVGALWLPFDYYPLCVENFNADQRGHPPQRPVPNGIIPTSPHQVLGPMTTSARRMTPTTIRRPRSQLPTFRVISFLPFRRSVFAYTPWACAHLPRDPLPRRLFRLLLQRPVGWHASIRSSDRVGRHGAVPRKISLYVVAAM
jgi:hypothetical protein